MAFVKTAWVDDADPAVTAAQLNRIEQGIDDLYQPSGYSVSVGNATAQGIAANNAETILVYSTNNAGDDVWDPQAQVVLATGRFTPKKPGKWRVTVSLRYGASIPSGTSLWLYVKKNGTFSKILQGPQIAGGALALGLAGSVLVQANGTTDYFEAAANQSNGSVQNTSADRATNFFQAEWVGF